MSPTVSVIIPAYNGDRHLTETLESVFRQSWTDYEVIVVDDGSTDQTRQCVERWNLDSSEGSPGRLQYRYQTNQGVASARNHGFQQAQGKYIAFLDQDDVWLPEKLALQVHCFQAEPEVGIVHSGWRVVDALGQPWSDIEPWHDAPDLDLSAWLVRMPVLLSAMLFRRDWLQQVGPMDTAYRQTSDVDLVQRLVVLGCKTAWVRQVTTLYRQHDRNDSLNTPLQAQEAWQVRDRFFAQPNLPDAARRVETASRYYALVWIAWRLFHTGHLEEMATYLERAFFYRPGTWTEMLVQWVELFQQYEKEYGGQLDVTELTRSLAWTDLIKTLICAQTNR